MDNNNNTVKDNLRPEEFELIKNTKEVVVEWMEFYKNEQNPDYRGIRKNNVLEFIKNTNNDSQGYIKTFFEKYLAENDYDWTELLNPTFFETEIEKFVDNVNKVLEL